MMSQQFGNYRILHPLGRGAFADVYLGKHISDNTQVAIKVLRMDMAATDVESFLREAHTITRLEHPHIIRVLECGVQENTPFLVMQYAPNGTLREHHPKGAILTPISILPYIKQIVSALQYAHDHKIIHRDMKPENMLLGQYNEILLSDFGLAIIVQSSSYQHSTQGIDGTLAYMAPEQFLGKAREASDQYALGVMIYEWLSGSRPFAGTPDEIRAQHMQAPPGRLCGRGLEVTPAVEHVVLTALAKDQYQRFPSVQDFATAFEQACSDIPTTVIRPWNIAHRRNTYFTGREDVLKRLHEELRQNKKAALTQAITGLGGIGKTQTVVEYAYRYRQYYKTILWVNADSLDHLLSNFAALAEPLNLPEKSIQDQSKVAKAVTRWLETHSAWLLIFDNFEDPEMVRDFLPLTTDGHILLTTRAQAIHTIAQAIELDKMTADEGALLLLRRARIIEPRATLEYGTTRDRTTARAISELLDGLPLALDQAGAYIEGTECSLSDYLHLYELRHAKLLQERGRFAPRDNHPDSVAATLSLSFEKALQADPAAADLLRLCAFLHPDAIPEEIITDGAPDLGRALRSTATDQFKLDTAIGTLRKYSLLRRNSELHTLTIHRLVQTILKERMNKKVQLQWAERAVRAVNCAFPDVEPSNWQRCQRLLSHAQICTTLIQQDQMTFPEAARLLHQTGYYLSKRAQYSQAEAFLQQTLKLRERTLGPDHLLVASTYDALAEVYLGQGRYSLSEATYQQALAIREKVLGPDHLDVVICLNNIAGLSYFVHGADYDRSEQLLQRALAILEKARGPEHLDVANNLDHLGVLYDYQGRYAEGIP
ncbi:MAG: serine/threonine-protein kinase, partial [Chloroflexota bacterium]|nr:serine/threonine-protein kinase [Chloroflexota bacterium]